MVPLFMYTHVLYIRILYTKIWRLLHLGNIVDGVDDLAVLAHPVEDLVAAGQILPLTHLVHLHGSQSAAQLRSYSDNDIIIGKVDICFDIGSLKTISLFNFGLIHKINPFRI
jgi:hypothetical protein